MYKNVVCFDITMNNFPSMEVVECFNYLKDELHENGYNPFQEVQSLNKRILRKDIGGILQRSRRECLQCPQFEKRNEEI